MGSIKVGVNCRLEVQAHSTKVRARLCNTPPRQQDQTLMQKNFVVKCFTLCVLRDHRVPTGRFSTRVHMYPDGTVGKPLS